MNKFKNVTILMRMLILIVGIGTALGTEKLQKKEDAPPTDLAKTSSVTPLTASKELAKPVDPQVEIESLKKRVETLEKLFKDKEGVKLDEKGTLKSSTGGDVLPLMINPTELSKEQVEALLKRVETLEDGQKKVYEHIAEVIQNKQLVFKDFVTTNKILRILIIVPVVYFLREAFLGRHSSYLDSVPAGLLVAAGVFGTMYTFLWPIGQLSTQASDIAPQLGSKKK